MLPKYPQLHDRDWLHRTYVVEERSLKETADLIGCSVGGVFSALVRHQIERRPQQGFKGEKAKDKYGPEAARLYAEGMTGEQVAAKLGVGRQTVYNILHELGVPRRLPEQRRKPGLDEQTIREYYLERRWGCPTIAKKFGVSPAVVENRLREYGIEPRGHSLFSDERLSKENLHRLYVVDALPVKTIAEMLEVSAPTIFKYIGLWGIPLRTRAQQARENRKSHPKSRGARWVNSAGYVMVSYVTESGSIRKLPEHRRVMEIKLGRILTSREQVHHINGDKTDNRVENLQLRQGSHGSGVVHRCNSCGSHDISAVEIAEPDN